MFPVVLNLKNKKAVVFGGGGVAERRVNKLLRAGAYVDVVSMDFTPGLKKIRDPRLRLINGDLRESVPDIASYDLVFIATSDGELNERLETLARKQSKLVNRADSVADFIIPATIEEDGILISISTHGRSPEMARHIKKLVKKALRKEDILFVKLQEYARSVAKEKIKNQEDRRGFLRSIMRNYEMTEMLKKGDLQGARELVRRRIDAYSEH
jgi:precorrin-2 dehydrogenase/sirohydrochlorin ferrochelatase